MSCGRNPVFLRITADRMQFVYKTCVMWTKPSVLRITVDSIQRVYNKTCFIWAKLTQCCSESQLTERSLSTRRVSCGQNSSVPQNQSQLTECSVSTTRRVSCGIRMFLRITADRMQSTRLVLPKVVGRIRLRSKHFDINKR